MTVANHQITWENLTRAILGLFLGLLIYLASDLISRVDRLEANQIRIMIRLRIEPEYTDSGAVHGRVDRTLTEPWEPK